MLWHPNQATSPPTNQPVSRRTSHYRVNQRRDPHSDFGRPSRRRTRRRRRRPRRTLASTQPWCTLECHGVASLRSTQSGAGRLNNTLYSSVLWGVSAKRPTLNSSRTRTEFESRSALASFLCAAPIKSNLNLIIFTGRWYYNPSRASYWLLMLSTVWSANIHFSKTLSARGLSLTWTPFEGHVWRLLHRTFDHGRGHERDELFLNFLWEDPKALSRSS